jgi:hypothetical protein
LGNLLSLNIDGAVNGCIMEGILRYDEFYGVGQSLDKQNYEILKEICICYLCYTSIEIQNSAGNRELFERCIGRLTGHIKNVNFQSDEL